MKLNAIDFCILWNKCDDLDEFCNRSGMKKLRAQARMRLYRANGIPLKDLRSVNKPGRPKLDFTDLAKRIGGK